MFNISPPTSLSCCLALDSLNSFLKDTSHYSYAAPTIYELLSNEPCPQTRDSSRIVLYLYFHHELIVLIFPNNFQTGDHQPELQQPYDEYLCTILKRYCKVHYCSDKTTEGIDHEVKPLFGTGNKSVLNLQEHLK